MFCPYCGTKLPGEAHFCVACGRRVPKRADAEKAGSPQTPGSPEPVAGKDSEPGVAAFAASQSNDTSSSSSGSPASSNPPLSDGAAPARPESPQMTTAAGSTADKPNPQGDLASQVEEVRATTKRRMPLFLLVVLVALGIAGAALAATVTWKYVIAPALAQRQEAPAAVTEQVAATEGSTSEAASTAAAANTTPAAATSSVTTQQAVFNDILSEYKAAQESGWTAQSDSQDVNALEAGIAMGPANRGNDLSAMTASYAYIDLGNDGTQDLVVAMTASDGSYTVCGVFIGGSSSPASVMNGDVGARSWWYVLSDGTLSHSASGGAYDNGTVIYTVKNGALVQIDSYGITSGDGPGSPAATARYFHGDKTVTKEEVDSLKASGVKPATDIDWHPLSEFKPIKQPGPSQSPRGL